MKHAQAEIFGIVIVVVVIIIGLVLFFALRNDESTSLSGFDSQLAQTTLNSMFKTHIDANTMGNGFSLREIIIKCADKEVAYGSDFTETCAYANTLIENILANTLQEWNKPYRFTLRAGDTAIPGINDFTNSDCTERTEKEAPGIYAIPHDPTIIARLDICKN